MVSLSNYHLYTLGRSVVFDGKGGTSRGREVGLGASGTSPAGFSGWKPSTDLGFIQFCSGYGNYDGIFTKTFTKTSGTWYLEFMYAPYQREYPGTDTSSLNIRNLYIKN